MTSSDLALAVLALLALGAVITPWLRRRAGLRRFAATHDLRFRGTIPSDKYQPYERFHVVRWAVLLHNVIEGRWKEFEIDVFDVSNRGGKFTGAIVTLPGDSSRFQIFPRSTVLWSRHSGYGGGWTTVPVPAIGSDMVVREEFPGSGLGIGPRATAFLQSSPPVFVETNVGLALVLSTRLVPPDAMSEFLDVVSSLARALDADAADRPR